MRALELSGQRFGRLAVLRRTDGGVRSRWLCACDCGSTTTVLGRTLKAGKTTSCGCVRDARMSKGNPKHGHSPDSAPSKTYTAWLNMIQRCTNPQNTAWSNYGGRGIAICARWMKFENFLADMGEAPTDRSLDRINNDGNYEPGNCRWATRREQNLNTRRSKRHG